MVSAGRYTLVWGSFRSGLKSKVKRNSDFGGGTGPLFFTDDHAHEMLVYTGTV